MEYYKLNKDEVLKTLQTTEEGLSLKEAKFRVEMHGLNELKKGKKENIFKMFFRQLNDALIYILLLAVVFTFIVGDMLSGIIILAIVLFNAIIGVILEGKANKAIENLKNMTTPKAVVKRDGVIQEIDSKDLTIGDIVILKEGSFIPADLRIIESYNLHIDESSLTGESVGVLKDADMVFDEDHVINEQTNMAFSSTFVTKGRGVGVVTHIGMQTEIGHIAKMLTNVELTQTPLQKRLNQFGKQIGKYVIILSVVIFLIHFFQELITDGKVDLVDLQNMIITIVSFAVAAIPESILVIVVVVLALGTTKLSKKKAIIKSLHAVETLGSVNVICSDKTGTLTENKMTVKKAYTYSSEINDDEIKLNEDLKMLLKIISFCNDADLNGDKPTGEGTEIALLEFAQKADFDYEKFIKEEPRIKEVPFESQNKIMITTHKKDNVETSYIKGAFDKIINLASHVLINGKEEKLTDENKDELILNAENMSAEGLRVLGASYQKEDVSIFVGLVGLFDPPRQETKEAILKAQKAGISVIMITGDHVKTANAIAYELNILKDGKKSMTGAELDLIEPEELNKIISDYAVFARVTPAHKVKILKAFKDNDNIVSMTGDGVNDSPALKDADIGVAMGISGTDVAKESAEMILADDNFETIIVAVEEGRNIYKNIKKSITFLLSCNLGEILILTIAVLFGWSSPLIATQILWINLITDSLPAIALGIDRNDPKIMDEKPRDKDEPLITKPSLKQIIMIGSLIGVLAMIVFIIGMHLQGVSFLNIINVKSNTDVFRYASSLAFVVVGLSQLFYSFSARDNKKSFIEVGLFNNLFLWIGFIIGIISTVFLIYFKPIQDSFGTYSLNLSDWLLAIGFSLIPFIVNEVVKVFKRKNSNS